MSLLVIGSVFERPYLLNSLSCDCEEDNTNFLFHKKRRSAWIQKDLLLWHRNFLHFSAENLLE